MLDFGAGEFVVVGVVALIAIGPKELPSVLRAIGRSVGKMRRMAGDFQNQFNDAMREMELEEARKKVEEMGKSVSDSVEAATHIEMPSVDLTMTDQPSGSTATVGASSEPVTVPQQSSSVLGHLPDIHAPSSENLLENVQSEVQAMTTQSVGVNEIQAQSGTPAEHSTHPEPSAKGVNV